LRARTRCRSAASHPAFPLTRTGKSG
jgi:hypothetical protein